MEAPIALAPLTWAVDEQQEAARRELDRLPALSAPARRYPPAATPPPVTAPPACSPLGPAPTQGHHPASARRGPSWELLGLCPLTPPFPITGRRQDWAKGRSESGDCKGLRPRTQPQQRQGGRRGGSGCSRACRKVAPFLRTPVDSCNHSRPALPPPLGSPRPCFVLARESETTEPGFFPQLPGACEEAAPGS